MTHEESRAPAPVITAGRFIALALVALLVASCADVRYAGRTATVAPTTTVASTATVAPTATIAPTATAAEVGADDITPTVENSENIGALPSSNEDGYMATGQIVMPSISSADEVGADNGVSTSEDGYIANSEFLSPFDTDNPAISNLDPDLLAAVQRAATDAARDGVEMFITSGWRSVRYQQALLDEAVVRYGSLAEARKWVNTPEKSTHVSGLAVDIGPTDATSWLSQHGSDYGLCQTYANEMWHYELAIEPGDTCPQTLSDASAS